MTDVVLRPAAEADVRAAVASYREVSDDLAASFLEQVDRLLQRLSVFPRSAQAVQGYDTVRRALVRRFSFAVFYDESDGAIVVLRVIHTSRAPSSWPTESA